MNRRDLTECLVAWSEGDETALSPLMEGTYDRLLRLAQTFLKSERIGHTLDAASLVNEAFLKLIQQDRVRWQDRAHFFAVAAKIMRRILLDHARHHERLKRGKGVEKVPLHELDSRATAQKSSMIAIDEALGELELLDPELAEVVVMKYFGGMKKEEIGEVLGISSATVSRRWRTARSWLYDYLREEQP